MTRPRISSPLAINKVMWWDTFTAKLDSGSYVLPLKGAYSIGFCDHDVSFFYSHGYPSYLRQNERKIKPQTKFQLASVSKFITASLCMSLQHHELISLNDPINQYFFDLTGFNLEDDYPPISIRHLLSHSAGIKASHGFLGVNHPNDTLQEIKDFCSKGSLSMDPTLVGNYHYTGLSQWILQRFLTLKTQKSYAELLKYFLAEPYELQNLTSDPPEFAETQSGSVALGLLQTSPEFLEGYHYFPEAESAAGVWASAEDLIQLITLCLDPSPLKIAMSFTNLLQSSDALTSQYRLGVELARYESKSVVQHFGVNPGYRCMFMASTRLRRGFSILCNDPSISSLLRPLSLSLLRLMHI